jgi:exodeoxyribonuclease-3
MRGQLHFSAEEHAALSRVTDFGLEDAFRLEHPERGHYSWWDYRAGAFRRNKGLRIDYLWITQPLVTRHVDTHMDKDERAKEKPSDHCPVVAEFRD